jgi:hypothetical protein
MLGDVSFLGRSRAIPLIDFIMGGGGNDGDGDWAVGAILFLVGYAIWS